MTKKPDCGERYNVVSFSGEGRHTIYKQMGVTFAESKSRENADFIAKRLNACSGLTDEQLKRVRAVNEMYEACKAIKEALDSAEIHDREWWGVEPKQFAQMRKALALADGCEPKDIT